MVIIESPHPRVDIPRLSITECLFEGLAQRRDAVVLTDGPSGREVSAGALRDGIERLAGGLHARGFGRGAVVALMAPNIPEFVTVFHAVAWAGGTITTINPTYTAHETRRQLKDSGAVLVVASEACAGTARAAAEGTGVREVAVIGGAGSTSLADLAGDPLAAQIPVDLENDVLVLPYSSGTTGLPKGVMLTHRNLVANVVQCRAALGVAPGEVAIAFLPFFHIYGMTVLMNLYLASGGALVTMPRFDLDLYLRLVAAHRTPTLYVVPPVVLAFARHPAVDGVDLPAVERVFCGAAPLGGEVGQMAADRLGCVVTQGYGMTELLPVSHATPASAPRSGASGLAVPNTECRIVDPETGADRARGEEGELWVRGPQVMKGYLGNDAATREALTEEGWLRTGDLALADAEGYVFIRERVKELIKVKGFQVAPAELEAELLGHARVADAAVLGRADAEAGEVPVAFVVRADGARLEAAEVIDHLAARLAAYKLPREVRFVSDIPKSPSGKILRRLLRERLGG